METKYDVGQVVYIPISISKIKIEKHNRQTFYADLPPTIFYQSGYGIVFSKDAFDCIVSDILCVAKGNEE